MRSPSGAPRLVSVSVLALILGLGLPAAGFAMAGIEAECRAMAEDEEVPNEDLDDYMAECIAAADTEALDDGSSEAGFEDLPEGETPDPSGGSQP